VNRGEVRAAVIDAVARGAIPPGRVRQWAGDIAAGRADPRLLGQLQAPHGSRRGQVEAHSWEQVRQFLDIALPPDPGKPTGGKLPPGTEEENPEPEITDPAPRAAAAWSGDPEYASLWPPATRRSAQRRHADAVAAAGRISDVSDSELYDLLFDRPQE